MNFRMDGSAGPSASTPDWSLAGSVVSLTNNWRGGLWQVDFVAFPGLGSGLHLDLGAFRFVGILGFGDFHGKIEDDAAMAVVLGDHCNS
jgi:hypothetical protein